MTIHPNRMAIIYVSQLYLIDKPESMHTKIDSKTEIIK